MRILVVHDREEVAVLVRDLILQTLGNNIIIDVAEDFHSTRRYLSTMIYDLLIMDLTIPFIKSKSSPDFTAAGHILQEIFTLGSLNIPGDVIGMTRDIEALELVATSLGPHLMVVIHEDAGGLWQRYLRDRVTYARRAAETRSISINQHFLYDVLLVTAMDRELKPYQDVFEMRDIRHFRGAKEFTFQDGSGAIRKGVAYSIGRSGQPSAASLSQALITFFRPRMALMSGYCGGVKSKVQLGDLIFFEAAYAWDYGKWSETRGENGDVHSVFMARPNPIDILDQETHRVAREMLQSDFCKRPDFLRQVDLLSRGKLKSVKMHLCPAGSGSAVVANDEIVAQIQGLNESIWAVDMECYGFYHAGKNTQVVKPQMLCIKAVSDFCNGEKGDDLHEACSYASSRVITDILVHRWRFDGDH